MLTKKNTLNKNILINLINLLIALIPLSLIIGNLAVNINIISICVSGLLNYKKEIFKINKKIYEYLIYAFFSYLILITLIQNIPNLENNVLYKEHIVKSFLFLRFLILFLVINKLVEENQFNLKLFYISSSLLVLIVGIDILIQVIFGKNILGYPITLNRPSSFFGTEHIAGGYIQKFSLFLLLFIAFFYKKKFELNFIFFLLSVIFFVVILLTGNRMPLLLYFFSIIIFYVINKQIQKIILLTAMVFIISYGVIKYAPNHRLNLQLNTFVSNSLDILKRAPEIFIKNSYKGTILHTTHDLYGAGSSGYLITFNSGVQTWKKNKIFGGGLKSFRLNCTYGISQTCNSHPHNYIIELLVDVGIIGFVLIYLAFIFSFFDFLKICKYNLNKQTAYLPFFVVIFLEFFPIKSSGSFFTTSNSIIIFFMLGVIIGTINSAKLKHERENQQNN